MRLRPVVVLSTVLLVSASAAPAAAAPSAGTSALGRYVVTLTEGSRTPPAAAAARAQALGGTVEHVYSSALRGYALSLPQALVSVLLRDPDIASIEPDRQVRLSASQPRPPYGLDRIDQRSLPLNRRYDYRATGAGVTAYVVDTGVRLSHKEFRGRAVSGLDTVDGGSADDCNGHGTHVAGTLGGTSYGVAKRVRLVAVRVLGCDGSGPTSDVIAGIDWVTAHHRPGVPAVANLSLGASASAALDRAVQGSIADGVSYAVAAGNGDRLGSPQDACGGSPGRVPEALTTGASDAADREAPFSNYGSCVDVYAPGVDVVSAGADADHATQTLSGTSMASPHVAGVAALYLERHRKASPAAVANALLRASTKGAVTTGGSGGLLGLGAREQGRAALLFSGV